MLSGLGHPPMVANHLFRLLAFFRTVRSLRVQARTEALCSVSSSAPLSSSRLVSTDLRLTRIGQVSSIDLSTVESKVKGSLADVLDVHADDLALCASSQGQAGDVILTKTVFKYDKEL